MSRQDIQGQKLVHCLLATITDVLKMLASLSDFQTLLHTFMSCSICVHYSWRGSAAEHLGRRELLAAESPPNEVKILQDVEMPQLVPYLIMVSNSVKRRRSYLSN